MTERRGVSARELALLAAIVAAAALLRLAHPGADVPWDVEWTSSPLLDAWWYLEGAAGSLEGAPPEHLAAYDLPVWTQLVRTWMRLTGPSLASACLLSGLISLAAVLLLWRILRPALGPAGALAGAAFLAAFYPFVALSRVPLVYGPMTLALLVAAAVWLRGGRLAAPWRQLHEAAAWALVLGAAAAVRPPAAALAGGLLLGHMARSPRLRLPLAAVCGAAGLALASLWLDERILSWVLERSSRLGWLGADTADRLDRYLARGLAPAELGLRILAWGGERAEGRGSGFFALAPWALLVSALGLLWAFLDRGRLRGARRETLVVFGGWGLAFGLGSLVLDYRPLRFFMVLGPPLAAFAAYAFVRALEAPRHAAPTPIAPARGPAWVRAAAVAVWGAVLAPHLASLLGPPRDAGVLVVQAIAGAALALVADAAGRARGRSAPAGRLGQPGSGPVVAAALLAAALVSTGLTAASRVAAPSWTARDANQAARRVLADDPFLVGPSSSLLALGNGWRRQRNPWIRTNAPYIDQVLARLQAQGATHLALTREQEALTDLVARFAERGVALQLVAVFPVTRPHRQDGVRRAVRASVLLYRFPWAEEVGYPPSAFERQRAREDVGASASDGAAERATSRPAPAPDPLLERVRRATYAFEARTQPAGE